ncbi:MAG: response regulator [Desulfobacterales bacterium]|nr:response regulator [Desulfobacterales bacterium]MDJ0915845.1 response regulator [Desulfobacterales bacterium]
MKPTLLLVDDEIGIRKVLSLSLVDAGYEVFTAENGAEAIALFESQKPAIVLCDIKMPGMDGIEVLRKIKQLNSDVEVIMFTGHGDMDIAIRSFKNEANDFITKPVNLDALEIALKSAEERIRMRRQLKEYTENLERLVAEKSAQLVEAERMAAIGETIAGLSHAIKNIANGLKGSIFVLKEGIDTDDKHYMQQGWQMVRGNVDKIRNLSLDLLNYGKYANIRPQLADPNQPMHAVAEIMSAVAAEQDILMQIELDSQLGKCHFDPEAINRCLMNIVSNALDACAYQKEASALKTVTLKTSKAKGWAVAYQISDDGPGMEADVQKRIFQGFFSTKGTEGTGIGLMMSKKIVDQHRGDIEVISAKGRGTTITIRLPG